MSIENNKQVDVIDSDKYPNLSNSIKEISDFIEKNPELEKIVDIFQKNDTNIISKF